MVTLLLDSENLEVALSATERAAAFQRTAIRVRRADVERVQLTDDPWTWLRGVRKPGTCIPNVIAAGTWHSTAGTDFVMVRGRRPGVVIDLNQDAPFQRLVLTTRHGLALVAALQRDVSGAAVDVSRIGDEGAEAGTATKPVRVSRPPRAATA